MKTAISIPDEVFEAAEDLAQKLGVSRSRLYSQAVSEFVARSRDDRVTERLNEVYGELDARVDPHLEDLQFFSISEKW
jgi:predicted transcriptional regulator